MVRALVQDYATFGADLPDDTVEQGGEIVKPGGANIAEHLRAALARTGLAPRSVGRHAHYGWAFEVPVESVMVWCMIQYVDPWLLITEVPSRFVHRLLGRRPDEKHAGVLNVLRPVLAGAPFSDCRWTTKAVYLAR